MTRGCFAIYVRQSRPFFFALPDEPAAEARKPEPRTAAPAPRAVDRPSPREDRKAA
jgi:hypothetical protein